MRFNIPTILLVTAIGAATASDIPDGILGHNRLGTYLTIEGVRAEKGLVGVCTLIVDTINGSKVDSPVQIWVEGIESLPKDTRCVIRGYESGRMIGIPDEVSKKENLPQMQAGWQFQHYFIFTSAVEPKDLKKSKKN